jgi:hypothetical protein
MSEETATVEVLTAEVRTLMVGSRQVTLSVFRQLDEVTQDWCEPFGRVNDKSTDERFGVTVVGRHTVSGALVRSFSRRPHHHLMSSLDEFGAWCCIAESMSYGHETYARIRSSGHFVVSLRIPLSSPVDKGLENGQWHYVSDDAQERVHAWADKEIQKMVDEDCCYEKWNLLPLIVLAGLR